MGPCPPSVVCRPSSVVGRLCRVSQLPQNLLSGFLPNFSYCLRLAKRRFKNFKTLLLPQITFEYFQTFSEFWIFGILSLQFLTNCFIFVNMGPYGNKNDKTLRSQPGTK